jgi:hypothetical protein
VQFQLYETSADRADLPGDLVPVDPEAFEALPPLQLMLPSDEGGATIEVVLHAQLTEVGALDVSLHAVAGPERWQLAFDLRGGAQASRQRAVAVDLPRAGGGGPVFPGRTRQAAEERINRIFGKSRKKVDDKEVRQMRKDLELALGAKRDGWTLPMLRELWEMLARHSQRRRRSADHEAVFFNLAGTFLRPGFGQALDEWRVGALWKIFDEGVQYHHEHKAWQAWWVMWRRIVGGLDAAQQRTLLRAVTPWLRPELAPGKRKGKVQVGGEQEMLRLVASLERLDPGKKAGWGEWLLDLFERGQQLESAGWALARLGARVPFSGAVHNVVDPLIAEAWVERLLRLSFKKVPNAAFAAAHIARRTDDRMRDVSEVLRARTAAQLEATGFDELAPMVLQARRLVAEEEAKFAGDTLPPGLLLVE